MLKRVRLKVLSPSLHGGERVTEFYCAKCNELVGTCAVQQRLLVTTTDPEGFRRREEDAFEAHYRVTGDHRC